MSWTRKSSLKTELFLTLPSSSRFLNGPVGHDAMDEVAISWMQQIYGT